MTTKQDRVAFSGMPGSPYTRKMIAALRYRRIAYTFIRSSHIFATGASPYPQAKVSLLPTFYFPGPDGALQAVTDSTPIIRRLEREHAGREIRPADPALAFLDSLIEDYGDEWLTKAMFHYRWAFRADIENASRLMPAWTRARSPDAELAVHGERIAKRQIERLRFVGSNEMTAPVIEGSYKEFLAAMEAHLRVHEFVFGARPGAADFALFGQLTQLAHFDPTSMAIAIETAPRVHSWVGLVDDLSGLEPIAEEWADPRALPPTTHALLEQVGKYYAPALLANDAAVTSGAERVETVIAGRPWVQQPFPYQAKCLKWLREEYTALSADARRTVDAALADTGCAQLF